MPAPFKQVTLRQFADILNQFEFTRKINSVHMHHTWRPNRSQYKGHETIVAMWEYHTKEKHWSDIAQHITIDPDGKIWLGRNWNRPPASASGHNGTPEAGPFMFEIIGDFDVGKDRFDGAQRDTVLEVIARVQRKCGLTPANLMFHRMMSSKSCPGSDIDYSQVVRDVEQVHVRLGASATGMRGADGPFAVDARMPDVEVEAALESLKREGADVDEPADADPCSDKHGHGLFDPVPAARALGLTPEQKELLRPHLVNLRMGRLSGDGEWKTSREDVEAIFAQHLPAAAAQAKRDGQPLRILFYAHGGLTDESAAVMAVHNDLGWWQRNHVYPIYFVWETGLFETLGQMIEQGRRGERGLLSDAADAIDKVVETGIRLVHGENLWGGMKLSAQLASADNTLGISTPGTPENEGGAHYAARKLADFCRVRQGEFELHAVGHSAGAVFHSHFLPCARSFGAPSFRSLHLMAPAVRVDVFKSQLGDLIGKGKGIDTVTMYTMKQDLELDDTCTPIYHKSLLYLIHRALEPERKAPILGLEECLRDDAELKRLFGIGEPNAPGEVVWSQTSAKNGRSATRSTSHGGFDNDAPTMSSIARRVLRKADDEDIVEYGTVAASARAIASGGTPAGWKAAGVTDEAGIASTVEHKEERRQQDRPAPRPPHGAPDRQGRRRALCVGIDDYPGQELMGCVSDARLWAKTLSELGFDAPRMLLDGQATRQAMVDELERMIGESRQGDVLVFQYSGHGTQVPTLDPDETDGKNEAFCPYDYATGSLLVDDELRSIFSRLPKGVNLSSFIDCCHSGTISRMGKPAANRQNGSYDDIRARFIPASSRLKALNRQFRQSLPVDRSEPFDREKMPDVMFAACQPEELAKESAGQGHFTRRATDILRQGIVSLTNAGLMQRVTAAFADDPSQRPLMDGRTAATSLALLAPLGALDEIRLPSHHAAEADDRQEGQIVYAGNGHGVDMSMSGMSRLHVHVQVSGHA
jgi:hypothetical protein